MKLCRFNGDRLGVVEHDRVADVSQVLDRLPSFRWARSLADPLISRLDEITPSIKEYLSSAPRIDLHTISLDAPIANPSKIIGAPVNYHAHVDEARNDQALHQGREIFPIDEIGCFLKASSALAGHGSILHLPMTGVRVDHEAEIAVIIGTPARALTAENALSCVAGYALALDMTVRGKQDRSMRKSCDGFAIVGPWLVTSDEIEDAANIPFELRVNGEIRQSANTGLLIRSIPELIEMCSQFYTLYPGDVIMSGTPAGVSAVASGDKIELNSPLLGRLAVSVQ